MAGKTVTVTLAARIDQYKRAMNDAKRSTDGFAGDASKRMVFLGGEMQNVGKKMTLGVTLPLGVAGAAAVKMSNDFNSTFGQMVGLAGVAAEDVDGLKEAVLELAGETARAPAELAEALYFAASAGLDTQQAMDAVTVAAKAAASGMGSTQDIVGLAASAIASYGAENITAAEATDILVSTIREGRAEPAELASTLGRVLPIAAQLGVEFDEVGGTIAVLSNVFGDTNRTVTATQGLFVKLLSPTKQGRDALAEMGTSVEELHSAIDQDGLLGALELLKSKGFDTNATALRALFDDIEGFQAASALLATDQETLAATFGATADSAGSLTTAWEALDKDALAMKQAMVDIMIALVEVGNAIGPIVADVAGGVGNLAGAFSDLDPTLQTIIIGVAALGAAAGPLLIMVGSLIRAWGTLKVAMAATSLSNPVFLGLAAVAGAAAIAITLFGDSSKNARADVDELTDSMKRAQDPMQGMTEVVAGLASENEELRNVLDASGATYQSLARAALSGEVGIRNWIAAVIDSARANGNTIVWNKDLEDSILDLVPAAEEARDRFEKDQRARRDLKTETEGLAAADSELTDELLALIEGTEGATDATDEATESTNRYITQADRVQGALDGAIGSLDGINDMYAKQVEAADAAREAQERYIESVLAGVESHFAYESAALALGEAYTDFIDDMNEGETSAIDMRQAEIGLAEQAYRTSEALAAESGALEGSAEWAEIMTSALEAQADKYPHLRDEIDQLIDRLGALPSEKVVDVNVNTNYREVFLSEMNRDNARAASHQADIANRVSGALAMGGPALAGRSYDFVERGPEILTVGGKSTLVMGSQNGFVTPLSPAGASSYASGGRGDVIIHTGPITTQARDGQQLLDEFNAALRRQGPGATRRNLGME